MSKVIAAPHAYLTGLLNGRPAPAAASATAPAWLNRLRSDAVERVGVLTVPTTRDEDWRFTDISALTKFSFQPPRNGAAPAGAQLEQYALPEAAARLTFVDGTYVPELSFNRAGVIVDNFTSGIVRHTAMVERHLARHAQFDSNVFTALNTAYLHDGALVIVPAGTACTAPIHLLFVATQAGVASYPRALVVAEARSAVTVVEDFVALQGGAYFTNAVSEVIVEANARVDHVRVQRESEAAFHIATTAVDLARDCRYRSVSIALGARISRYDLRVRQNAPAAESMLDGLALITGSQLADTHTCIVHAEPNGKSRQLHKCIVDGSAHAVFNGKIMVRPAAQQTDSSQSSRNLLLSARGRIDTKPQLEIYADDVKCAHGATVGQLDADEIFYLRSRGLTEIAARNLLTYAFGAEVLKGLTVPTLKRRLERTLLERTEERP